VEAGDIDPRILRLIGKNFNETFFIARTEQSADKMREFGFAARVGTDTAWIFEPAPPAWARGELEEKLGWIGDVPLLGVAVINPFWWPVRPNVKKLLLEREAKRSEYHYDRWYFMSDSEERRARFRTYLSAVAEAVNRFAAARSCKVAIFGMEALDRFPCSELAELLEPQHHVFSSRDYDAYQMTALLRSLSMLVTSRYHAQVLAMPAGVPSIAISMDERLRNLMEELGTADSAYLRTDEPELGSRLAGMMEDVWARRASLREDILRLIPQYLDRMAGMGRELRAFIADQFPGFPLAAPPAVVRGYLPPLSDELSALVTSDQSRRHARA
jgi:polysaccharide pyruvyl transferase WcaK-like protein